MKGFNHLLITPRWPKDVRLVFLLWRSCARAKGIRDTGKRGGKIESPPWWNTELISSEFSEASSFVQTWSLANWEFVKGVLQKTLSYQTLNILRRTPTGSFLGSSKLLRKFQLWKVSGYRLWIVDSGHPSPTPSFPDFHYTFDIGEKHKKRRREYSSFVLVPSHLQ